MEHFLTDISIRVELEELNQPACGRYTLQPFRGSMEHFLTDISNRVELEELNQPACGWYTLQPFGVSWNTFWPI